MELRKWNKRTGRTRAETRVVSVRIPVELHESVKKLAEAEGSSVSAVCETSLERALKTVKKGLVPH
jgi:predicted HicB family RNase H-like nuclease